MVTTLRKLFITALLLLPVAAMAQGLNPTNGDMTSETLLALRDLATQHSDVFGSLGHTLWICFGTLMIVIYGCKWQINGAAPVEIANFIMKLVATQAMLHWYTRPIPWCGVTFANLIPEMGRQLAGILHTSIANDLGIAIQHGTQYIKAPGIGSDTILFLLYPLVFGLMALLQTIAFLVTLPGPIMTGILGVFGQIAIPFLLLPPFTHMFWGWIRAMIEYSLYPVAGAAYLFIWATLNMNLFFNQILASGNWSLVYWEHILGPVIAVNVFFLLCTPVMYMAVHSWIHGHAASMGGWGTKVVTTVSHATTTAVRTASAAASAGAGVAGKAAIIAINNARRKGA